MFDQASLILFMTASITLLVIPGPAVLFVVARSIEHGRWAGIVSTLGISLGTIVHILFAAFGLSAILMQSALAFSLIKYLGAVYLVYLGIKTLMGETKAIEATIEEDLDYWRIFRQGIVVNVLNPKTALFFFAFLPQFVNTDTGSVAAQVIVLGLIFVGLATVSDSVYAVVAGAIRDLIAGNQTIARIQKVASGFIYIGLGAVAAFSGNNQS
ncbi:MAG: LysE family translocator [Chloroflexota bacterium]